MIKRIVFLVSISAAITPALATDVGVSVTVGQPGFYGQIDIGNFPQPHVVYEQPVIVERPPQPVVVAPIYLHVPPGHEKHWSKHCADYHACNRPVLFVRDDWYNDVYVPLYKCHGSGHGKADRDEGQDHEHGKGHGRGHDDEDR